MHHDHFGKPYDNESSGGGEGIAMLIHEVNYFTQNKTIVWMEEVGRCHTMKF